RVGSEMEPSAERLLALAPDVVISAETANRRETVAALERLGVPVYVTRTPDLQGLRQTILDLGRLVGRDAQAAALAGRIDETVARARARTNAVPVPALVVVWNDPLYVVGRATFASEILAAAGGRNVADDAATGFPTFPIERVLARAPEVIVVGSRHQDGA